eukprot:m.32925 g.32925  ORF g.32925 m.32925 type:complete len:120 (-) comp14168_c0_seq5:296-655(-)
MAGAGDAEVTERRLKSAVHYTVGEIIKAAVAEDAELPQFSRKFYKHLSDLTFRQFSTVAFDLQSFARHAKRTTVSVDDVKLVSRRSEGLHEHIRAVAQRMAEVAEDNRKHKRKKTKTSN